MEFPEGSWTIADDQILFEPANLENIQIQQIPNIPNIPNLDSSSQISSENINNISKVTDIDLSCYNIKLYWDGINFTKLTISNIPDPFYIDISNSCDSDPTNPIIFQEPEIFCLIQQSLIGYSNSTYSRISDYILSLSQEEKDSISNYDLLDSFQQGIAAYLTFLFLSEDGTIDLSWSIPGSPKDTCVTTQHMFRLVSIPLNALKYTKYHELACKSLEFIDKWSLAFIEGCCDWDISKIGIEVIQSLAESNICKLKQCGKSRYNELKDQIDDLSSVSEQKFKIAEEKYSQLLSDFYQHEQSVFHCWNEKSATMLKDLSSIQASHYGNVLKNIQMKLTKKESMFCNKISELESAWEDKILLLENTMNDKLEKLRCEKEMLTGHIEEMGRKYNFMVGYYEDLIHIQECRFKERLEKVRAGEDKITNQNLNSLGISDNFGNMNNSSNFDCISVKSGISTVCEDKIIYTEI